MSGATVIKLQRKSVDLEVITLTPDMAYAMLEKNKHNRPLDSANVARLERAIKNDRWKFNGDTIKISEEGDVLDGQHRLWAVINTGKSVRTAIVYGVKRDAFATIDTARKLRTGSDVISINGVTRHRKVIASALTWLIRWQAKDGIPNYRAPENRVENADIEDALRAHPEMGKAAERAIALRRLCNVSVMAFLYYVLANRNQEIADRMMDTLEDPSGIAVSDPFFRLRNYFTANHHHTKDAVMTIALAIKAANAAHENKKLQALSWRSHGKNAERFPDLEV
jgi:hypothetical protein